MARKSKAELEFERLLRKKSKTAQTTSAPAQRHAQIPIGKFHTKIQREHVRQIIAKSPKAPATPSVARSGPSGSKILALAATRRKMAQIGPPSMRQANIAAAEKLEKQADATISHEVKTYSADQIAENRKRVAAYLKQKRDAELAGLDPQSLNIKDRVHAFTKTRNLQRSNVPNPQSLNRSDYETLHGTDRDVSPELTRDYGVVLKGPTSLNHEARLRRTGKVSGHWAMYAYLVNTGEVPSLGIQFKSGFRCWYPGTGPEDYRAIVNAESGSYYVHDHLMNRPYTQF